METLKKYYRVDRHKIGFLRFILEAYDGIAVFTTIDPFSGMIELQISPGCEEDVEMLLKELKSDIMIDQAPVILSKRKT